MITIEMISQKEKKEKKKAENQPFQRQKEETECLYVCYGASITTALGHNATTFCLKDL